MLTKSMPREREILTVSKRIKGHRSYSVILTHSEYGKRFTVFDSTISVICITVMTTVHKNGIVFYNFISDVVFLY